MNKSISIGLFLISGFVSEYIFSLSEDKMLLYALIPGLLFTITAVVVFIIANTKLSLGRTIIYCTSMYLTYLTVFFLTFLTGAVAVIVGLMTTSIGAYITFGLTNRFIRKIYYNPTYIFFLGGLSFFLNDILLMTKSYKVIELIPSTDGEIKTMFAGAFLLWEVIVGAMLSIVLQSGKRESQHIT